MRPFELVLIATLVLRLLVDVRGSPPSRDDADEPTRGVAALLVAVALAGHLLLEGWRWNLVPVYGVAVVVSFVALVRRSAMAMDGFAAARQRREAASISGTRRIVVGALGLIGLAVITVPAWVFPVPKLPAPTGPWAVGTTSIETWVDTPAEPSAETAIDGPRRVRARIWYPAADGPALRAADVAPWLEHFDAMLPALGRRAGLPAWTLAHLRYTRVHARWNAPLGGDEVLGVVTFGHGRRGFAAQGIFLMEELASHGWLVVAPEHPGEALFTVYDDGTSVAFDPATFGEGLEGEAYAAAIRALGRRWANDTRHVLDALAQGAGPAGLAEAMDRGRLIATGHSTGGGAAFAVCDEEPGCRAIVGLDPWMLPAPPELFEASPDGEVRVPVLGLFSDPALGFFEPENLQAFDRLAAATRNAGSTAERSVYPGAGHMDFADVALLSPLADRLGLYVGPAPAREMLPRARSDVLTLLHTVP